MTATDMHAWVRWNSSGTNGLAQFSRKCVEPPRRLRAATVTTVCRDVGTSITSVAVVGSVPEDAARHMHGELLYFSDARQLRRADATSCVFARRDVALSEIEENGMATTAMRDPSRELTLVQLLSEGKIADARTLAAEVGGRWQRVLSPPVVRLGPKVENDASTQEFAHNREWLRQHEGDEKYRGKWVALRDGELLGSDDNCAKLQRAVEANGTVEGSLFVRLV